MYKVFIKIIQNRICQLLDESQSVDQAGFRKGFSTTDHLHTLNQIIEKYKEYNLVLYVAFVDYIKAFDSVKHNCLFQALLNQNIPSKYVRILRLFIQTAKRKSN